MEFEQSASGTRSLQRNERSITTWATCLGNDPTSSLTMMTMKTRMRSKIITVNPEIVEDLLLPYRRCLNNSARSKTIKWRNNI